MRIAVAGALALGALGWLVLGARTNPGTSLKSSTVAAASSRNVQGVIRMTAAPQARGEPDASSSILAGLKLDRTLRAPVPAQPASAEPARTPAAR